MQSLAALHLWLERGETGGLKFDAEEAVLLDCFDSPSHHDPSLRHG